MGSNVSFSRVIGGLSLCLFSALCLVANGAAATDMNAGVVVSKMGTEERHAFVAGIVEGLAIARFRQDNNKPDGMQCIYDWFYKDPDTPGNIYAAFQHYPDYPPGTVVDVMVRKVCA